MKITRANVARYAKEKGLEEIEDEGYLDGFAYQEPDIIISGRLHKGRKIKFKPLAEWEEGIDYE
jgi:hypothetical protein